MTNLQTGQSPPFKRHWLLVGLPIAAGVILSVGLAAGGVWPAWQRLQIDQRELEQLAEQRQRLPLLRAQLVKLSDNVAQEEQRSRQILGLIAGSGQIKTFMAQLSAEAQRSGVALDGYEPITIAAPGADAQAAKPNAAKDKTPAPPPDPLLAPGLQKTSFLLSARGSGPQLLNFLRRLEALSLLVVQSDLSLKHDSNDAATATQLRLNLSLYSQAEPGNASP
jgi:type IV pilus assembly protein PilO